MTIIIGALDPKWKTTILGCDGAASSEDCVISTSTDKIGISKSKELIIGITGDLIVCNYIKENIDALDINLNYNVKNKLRENLFSLLDNLADDEKDLETFVHETGLVIGYKNKLYCSYSNLDIFDYSILNVPGKSIKFEFNGCCWREARSFVAGLLNNKSNDLDPEKIVRTTINHCKLINTSVSASTKTTIKFIEW